jgi:hypothetical protein
MAPPVNVYNCCEGRKPIKYKPITHITPKTDECRICFQKYDSQLPIVECMTCHQHLHTTCIIDWLVNNIMDGMPQTCPFCRSQWIDGSTVCYPIITAPF